MSEKEKKNKYNRILLKLSGESLAEPGGHGIAPAQARHIAELVKSVHDTGVDVAIVIGAGNLRDSGLYGHVGDHDERSGTDGCP
jgi:uridylate kinase